MLVTESILELVADTQYLAATPGSQALDVKGGRLHRAALCPAQSSAARPLPRRRPPHGPSPLSLAPEPRSPTAQLRWGLCPRRRAT
jgi:hypothetical protein